MTNPFAVSPPSILEALLMGQQGYDRARKSVKENQLAQGQQNAVQALNRGDLQSAFAEAVGTGNADLAKAIATQGENTWSQRFKESEAARSGEQFAQSHGIQRAQLGLQQRQLDATIAQQGLPAGFRRNPDGTMGFIPGGPADPRYVGGLTEAKKPTEFLDDESKMRKEFEGNIKPYLETRRGYERILGSKDDAAGDIALVFGFMKALDPGSVVREGEFATAQNAAGVPDQVKNIYNRALEGTRLNPGQRNMFKAQAGALYKSARGEYDIREKQTRDNALQYKLDPNRIIVPLQPVGVSGARGVDLPPPPSGFTLVP